MRLILVRHGEPDYSGVESRGFFGHGLSLAPLSEDGVKQAEAAARDERLRGAELIVASPYTRALQTAAIISRHTGLDIKMEIDLHEWLPDLSFQCATHVQERLAVAEYRQYNGVRGEGNRFDWEESASVAARAFGCLQKYESFNKIIAVCHANVMRTFAPPERFSEIMPYCEILETDFEKGVLV